MQLQVQAGGDQLLTKLLTAAKAGNPPDLAQVEYQVLPTLVSNNYLANIASYASGLKSDFPVGNWDQVTLGTSAVYGIPQDAAPMALFYRADLFKKYGLTVPATWAQFAADATKLHAEAPGVYLDSFSSVDPGEFAGLTQQAGAQWWTASGSTWTVGIDSAASQKVASYWQSLIASGGVDNQPQWTPAWTKGMNDGKYIAWVSDIWAPGDMPTESPSNAGKWVMARAAAVDRGRPRRRQLGRILDRGHGRVEASAGRRRVRHLAEYGPDSDGRARLDQRHLPRGHRRGERVVRAAVVLRQPAGLLVARQAVRGRGLHSHLGSGRERGLQRIPDRIRQRGGEQGVVPQPARPDTVDRAERHEEERLHGPGRLT